ncbi:hypothetical protein [Pseudomonas viridiflava]|uniref:hypothetical protein n=1 Tax=Pseudomonas viridiflava TaxID=33069 RepID=UPI000F059C62|nr:hypothetical protein [Pseudomonas viridiflava]
MNAIALLNNPLLAVSGLEMNVSRLDFGRLKHKYTASSEAEISVRDWDIQTETFSLSLLEAPSDSCPTAISVGS